MIAVVFLNKMVIIVYKFCLKWRKNMKKILLGFILSVILIGSSFAAEGDIKLPEPQKTGGKPLMEALSLRSSHREFSGKEFDPQTISNVLWSAFGINRDGVKKRTIPTAKNEQNLSVYALLPSGMYFYNSEANKLEIISSEDYRADAGKQTDMLEKTAMILVYAEKLGDSYSKFNTGAAAQNVGLYAASADLGNVVIGYANIKELGEVLKLPKGMQVQVIQALGYKN